MFVERVYCQDSGLPDGRWAPHKKYINGQVLNLAQTSSSATAERPRCRVN